MTLRERFCNNKRRLNRRVNRYMMIAALGLLAFANIQHLNSKRDREHLHAEFQEMRRQAELSREMLDARARIQIIVIQKNWEKLSEEEKNFVRDNWKRAEYDSALPLEK